MFSRLFDTIKVKFLPIVFFGLSLLMLASSLYLFTANINAPQNQKLAKANVSQPDFCNGPTSPTWNSYPRLTNSHNPNWNINTGECFDIPLLSFYPINTTENNPREITIGKLQSIDLEIYYNNSAKVGSPAITNPTVKVFVKKISDTKYQISAELSGGNTATVTSAQKGGDLFVNLPSDTKLEYTANSTHHFIDAIERADEATRTGRTRYDVINDNGTNSNPIFSQIDGYTLGSTNGFNFKPSGVEAGYLGYGYILTKMKAQVVVTTPANNPPVIPGQEITIIRGRSGSFNPLNPTDQDNDYPVSLNTSSVLPNFCTLTGTTNSQGGGQIITCQTNSTTPVRTEFNITPTDSKGLVGTSGKFIVNVIEPSWSIVKKCFKLNTSTDCNSANLKPGDQIKYELEVTNASTQVDISNYNIIDDFDETKLENITAISDGGILDQSFNNFPTCPINQVCILGTAPTQAVVWNNLTNLTKNNKKVVSFQATIKSSVGSSNINNIAIASPNNSTNLPTLTTIRTNYQFPVSQAQNPNFTIVKKCFVKNTTTDCSTSALNPGQEVMYKISVKNTGNTKGTGVKVTDTYDKNKLENIVNINPTGSLDSANGIVVWTIGDLNVGDSRDLTFEATIRSNVTSGTVITNIAVLKVDNFPDITVRADFTVTIPPITETPRTGGFGLAFVLFLGSMVSMFAGFVFYQNSKKVSKNFIPARKKEVK